MIRRGKVPTNSRTPGSAPITPKDLEVGAQLELYGKVVLLTDADDYTRQW